MIAYYFGASCFGDVDMSIKIVYGSFIFHNAFYFSLPLISSIIIMSEKLLPWNTMQLNDLVVVDGIYRSGGSSLSQ